MENTNSSLKQPVAPPPGGWVTTTQRNAVVDDLQETAAEINWEAKYLAEKAAHEAEVVAHDATKLALKAYEALAAKAKAMGFTGAAGVHGGA